MVSFCFPSQGGVIPCPCGNPPSAVGRGCDNFGAGPAESGLLDAVGAASLAADTLVFTASGENSTSLTVFLQAPGSFSAGLVFGAGVRCGIGDLKRLYVGPASAGSITRPGSGDLDVHSRSAALGDPLAPGVTRYYFSYYRDPLAAGPCSSSASTFNSTQAGEVLWNP